MKYHDAPPKAVLRLQGEIANTLEREARELPEIADDELMAALYARLRVKIEQVVASLRIRSRSRLVIQAEQRDLEDQRAQLSVMTAANEAKDRVNHQRTNELDQRRLAMGRKATRTAANVRRLRDDETPDRNG